MPVFKRNNGTPVTGPVTLVVGNTLRLKLDGMPKNAASVTHFDIRSNQPNVVVTNRQARETQREQVFTLKAERTAELVMVKAYRAGDDAADCNDAAVCVPPLTIRVVAPIVLPDENTDAGILVRLLLAESISPGDEDNYGDGEDVFVAMRLMRNVLENRIRASQHSQALKSYIACNPVSLDFRGIVFANRCGNSITTQFEGFENFVIQGRKVRDINNIVAVSNDGADLNFSNYRKHVEEALLVSHGKTLNSVDLGTDSVLFWRTANRGKPSPYAVKIKAIGGQDFYALTEGYLSNPNQPGQVP